MRRSLVLTIAVTMFLGMVSVPGAVAAKPVVEFEFSDTFGPGPWFDLADNPVTCKDGAWNEGGVDPDFTVMIKTDISVRHTHQAIGGDIIKHQTWVRGTDTMTNSADSDKVASGDFKVTDLALLPADVEDGLLRIHGLGWHIVAPGFGSVFLEAGRLVFDFSLPGDPFVSFSGRSDFGAFEFDAVCAALS